MNFRIFRTFRWQPVKTNVIGGREELELVFTDTFQFQYDVGTAWRNVPVVEDEKPMRPDEIQRLKLAGGVTKFLDHLRRGGLC